MSRFFAGFGAATVLWGGVAAALVLTGILVRPVVEPPAPVGFDVPADAGVLLAKAPRRGRRGARADGQPGGAGGGAQYDEAPEDILTGDDLGDDTRTVHAGDNGGEEQLTPPQIEAAFDGVFPRIRRCLVLVDGEVRGRLMFRFRVAHDGHVVAVNLQGPSNVTGGEPGDCLRAAARGAHFPSFDGPDTFASYPLTLE